MRNPSRAHKLFLPLALFAVVFGTVVTHTVTSGDAPLRPYASTPHHPLDVGEIAPILYPFADRSQIVGTNDPSGKRGAGGRAIAHHHGARRISDRRITHRAPDARLFYVGGERGLEPTLAVNGSGTIFYVAQRPYLGGPRSAVMRSRDGGVTWENVAPGTHATTADPFIWLDKKTGRLFDVDLAAPGPNFAFWGLQVSFSDDEGDSWTSSVVPLGWNSDHQNLFAGPSPNGGDAPRGYAHVVYLCSIGGGAYAGTGTATTCSRSLDGGIIFSPTGEPAFAGGDNDDIGHFGIRGHCGGETGHGFVDRRGWIYLARGWCGQPWLAVSHDEGMSWDRVQVADNGMPEASYLLQEHEAGVAVDEAGNVYVVWTARNRLPYLAISRNNGKSFGQPMMIGPPGLREASLPTIDIGAKGRVAVAYIGSTNAPGGRAPTGEGSAYHNATWNGYVTITANALERDPIFYTASINDPDDPLVKGDCGIVRCQQQFDFIDVVIGSDGTPWTAMIDGCVSDTCETVNRLGFSIVGHLVGGPSLGAGGYQ